MLKTQNLIIGFGKAGKTLASIFAKKGESVVLIEKSPLMYGGTCINVACIPSKSLELKARESAIQGGTFIDKSIRYKLAINDKRLLTAALRKKNYENLVNLGVTIIDGEASFVNDHQIKVITNNEQEIDIIGDRIIINTGSYPFVPPIPGIKESLHIYTSETLLDEEKLPEKLIVLGGGYIGLEFASYYNNFGSTVTIIQDGLDFIPREDSEIAKEVEETFKKRHISLLKGIKTLSIKSTEHKVILECSKDGNIFYVEGDALLVATGRRANINALHLENTNIEVSPKGYIPTNNIKETNVKNIYAVGDVSGGLQFTYISLDDARIIKDNIYGNKLRNDDNRGAIPYTVFIDPALSRVGLTEKEALEKGYDIGVKTLKAIAIPKARILHQTEGILKVIIDKKTNLILGAHLYCAESYEIVNLIKLAIDNIIPYQYLRDNIYNHPTMSESFNDLFSII